MNYLSKILLLFIILVFAGCSVPPPSPLPSRRPPEPVIKIGITSTSEDINFSMNKKCRIVSHDGKFIAKGIDSSRWSAYAIDTSPAKPIYLLVAASMSSVINARKMTNMIAQKGIKSFILPFGKEITVKGKTIINNRLYRVCLKKHFNRKDEAQKFQDSIRNKIDTFIITKYSDPKGTIILRNKKTGQTFESSMPINIESGITTVYNLPAGVGYHWEKLETNKYSGIIEFRINIKGELTLINIVPLETYLKGVVPSEMPYGFPLEALKAQAVAARGEALAKIGIAHSNDPFDICDNVHCQVYTGLSKRKPSTDKAVDATRGLVMFHDNRICDAVYSAVCGGHTENSENVWDGDFLEYLQGGYDSNKSSSNFGDLSKEKNIRNWIDSFPQVYCNTVNKWILPAMEYTKKYFRWEVNITQEKITNAVEKYTGQYLGSIIDLIPVKRGVSGRISTLKIIGTENTVILNRELKIRKALSAETLWSSCFYVIKKTNGNNIPFGFIIKGAGFGHGVGMCQTGAAGMALNGHNYKKILKHYYKNTKLKRLY